MALVLLVCCALLVSSFEVAKKKTDKAKKQSTTSPTDTAAGSTAHTASISPEGVVTVDGEAGASPAATTTTSATTTGTTTPAKKVKPSKPAVSASTTSADPVSEAVPVLLGPLLLSLEHDLVGDGSWTERGAVEVTFGSGSGSRAAVKLTEVTLSDKQQQHLLTLAANNGYYRVRVQPSHSSVSSKDTAAAGVLASNRACALVASALHENLVLHFDIHGSLLSIAYTSPIAACPATPATALPSTTFTSRAKLSFGRTAERPQNIRVRQQPGEAGMAQAEGGGGEGAGGEGKGAEEQSFFMK